MQHKYIGLYIYKRKLLGKIKGIHIQCTYNAEYLYNITLLSSLDPWGWRLLWVFSLWSRSLHWLTTPLPGLHVPWSFVPCLSASLHFPLTSLGSSLMTSALMRWPKCSWHELTKQGWHCAHSTAPPPASSPSLQVNEIVSCPYQAPLQSPDATGDASCHSWHRFAGYSPLLQEALLL